MLSVRCNVYGRKNQNSDAIKEVSSKGRDMSNLQTGKDANIMRKIYQSSRFYHNNAFWKYKIYIFQISDVRTGVCAYRGRYTHANLRLTLINGTKKSVVNLFCVWSQSIFCLFVFTPFHKKFLRFISGDVSRNSLSTLSALAIPGELVVCLSLLKRPKTELCK